MEDSPDWLIFSTIGMLPAAILLGIEYFTTEDEIWLILMLVCIVAAGILFSVYVMKYKNAILWTLVVDWLTVGFALFAGWKYYSTRSDRWLWIMVASLVTLVTWWAIFAYMKSSEFKEREERLDWYMDNFGFMPVQMNPLFERWAEALRTSNMAEIEALWDMESARHPVNHPTDGGLKLAVQADNLVAVRFLLDHGADPNDPFEEGGYTPIFMAKGSRPNFKAIMDALIGRGADVNYRWSEYELSPMMEAIIHRDVEMVKYLLDHGSDPLARDAQGQNAMFYVAKMKPKHGVDITEKMIQLLSPRVPIDSIDTYGITPLFEAVALRNLPAVRALVQHGANVNYVDPFGDTPLTIAIKSFLKQWDVRREELNALNNMDILQESDHRYSMMFRQSEQDRAIRDILATVDTLLELGADFKRPNKAGKFAVLEDIRELFPLRSEEDYQHNLQNTEDELVRTVKEQSRAGELATYRKWMELIDKVHGVMTKHLQTLNRRANIIAEMIQEEIVGMPTDVIGEEEEKKEESGESKNIFRSRKGINSTIAEYIVGPYLSTKYEYGGRNDKNKKGKVWKYPRKWSEEFCRKTKCNDMGFSQKASCRPYKNCYKK